MSSTGEMMDIEPGTRPVDQNSDATKVPDTTSEATQRAPSPCNQAKLAVQQDAVGHDSSHLLQDSETATLDSTAAVQQISDNREPSYTRQEPTTSQIRQVPENSAIASLKHEHSSRTQSPLRESSVPVPSTEMAVAVAAPPAPPKRSHHKKKGVAAVATTKRSAAVPAKRSHKKKIVSASATPAQSSPAPRSVRTASSPARSSPEVDGDGGRPFSGDEGEEEEGEPVSDSELYCICRKPDTGTFMIGCDGGCDDWFHGKCVDIGEKWKVLIDKYICPFCEEKGVGETTWKRMCRRTECIMPAMVSKGTKYCSDRCGLLFMQELVAERTRKQVEAPKSRNNRKEATEDLGARGGVISAGELKAILAAAPTYEQLRALGDGSVSPLSASSPTAAKQEEDTTHESALNDIERERIQQLYQLRSASRTRHALLKDRYSFAGMLKDAAARLAEHRNVKSKDLCGYDSRLAWTEDEFAVWRDSATGKEALKTHTLPLPKTEDGDGDVSMTEAAQEQVCTKRKCAKHFDWSKLAIEDTRFEIQQNAEVMRRLEKEEKEIIERARLRAREIKAGGVGGTVEFHDEVPKESKEDKAMGIEPVVEHPKDTEMIEQQVVDVKVEVPDVSEGQDGKDVKTEVVEDDDDDDNEVDMVDAIAATV